jgi:hypothetical protein
MASRSIVRRILRIFRIVLLGSCVCCLIIGLGLAIYTTLFLNSALRTTGEVVSLDERYDSQNQTTEYAPVFHFVAEHGKAYTVTSTTATHPAGFNQGDTVQVIYRKNNPEGATIDSFWQLWLGPVVLLFIGVSHGIIGGVLLLIERRLARKESLAALAI